MDCDPIFLEQRPPELCTWVEAIWYSRGELSQRRERVLPCASTDIVINFGPAMRLAEGDGVERITGTTVSGLMTRPIVLEHPVVHEALGMRLTPLGLRTVLGIPLASLRDVVVHLHDTLDHPADHLAELCGNVPTAEGRIRRAVQWLAARVERFGESTDPLVAWAARRIEQHAGAVSIAALQQSSGYGATRFNQRFRAELGVVPKRYARLVRFRAALDRLATGQPLADLSACLGYSDQAHMNRDFRELGGVAPTLVQQQAHASGLTLAE